MIKSIFRGLGVALTIAPWVLSLGGGVGFLVDTIVGGIATEKITKIEREFKETNTYDTLLAEKREALDVALDNGEIDEKEHTYKVDYLVSDESTRQILQESESYMKPEYTRLLKINQGVEIASYTLLGIAGLGIASLAVMNLPKFNGETIAEKLNGKSDYDDDFYM